MQHARVYRPWGWYQGLNQGDRYQVKCIMVKPQAKLSLQSHHHRSEHWVVVTGTVEVTRGEQVELLSENQSTYIPIGEKHRLANPGKISASSSRCNRGRISVRTISFGIKTFMGAPEGSLMRREGADPPLALTDYAQCDERLRQIKV